MFGCRRNQRQCEGPAIYEGAGVQRIPPRQMQCCTMQWKPYLYTVCKEGCISAPAAAVRVGVLDHEGRKACIDEDPVQADHAPVKNVVPVHQDACEAAGGPCAFYSFVCAKSFRRTPMQQRQLLAPKRLPAGRTQLCNPSMSGTWLC